MTLNLVNTMSFMKDVVQLVNYKAARAILIRVQPIAPDSSDEESETDDSEHVEQAARRNERLIEAIMLLKDEVHEMKRKALVQKTGYLITDMMKLLLSVGGICATIWIVYSICCRH